jgi:hypothetical protein
VSRDLAFDFLKSSSPLCRLLLYVVSEGKALYEFPLWKRGPNPPPLDAWQFYNLCIAHAFIVASPRDEATGALLLRVLPDLVCAPGRLTMAVACVEYWVAYYTATQSSFTPPPRIVMKGMLELVKAVMVLAPPLDMMMMKKPGRGGDKLTLPSSLSSSSSSSSTTATTTTATTSINTAPVTTTSSSSSSSSSSSAWLALRPPLYRFFKAAVPRWPVRSETSPLHHLLDVYEAYIAPWTLHASGDRASAASYSEFIEHVAPLTVGLVEELVLLFTHVDYVETLADGKTAAELFQALAAPAAGPILRRCDTEMAAVAAPLFQGTGVGPDSSKPRSPGIAPTHLARAATRSRAVAALVALEGPMCEHSPAFGKAGMARASQLVYILRSQVPTATLRAIPSSPQDWNHIADLVADLFALPVGVFAEQEQAELLNESLDQTLDPHNNNNNNNNSSSFGSFLSEGGSLLRPSRARDVRPVGDPENMPIRSDENVFLVRSLRTLTLKVREATGWSTFSLRFAASYPNLLFACLCVLIARTFLWLLQDATDDATE